MGHCWQKEAASTLEAVPAKQLSQTATPNPVLDEYFPLPQGVHDDAPSRAYVPDAQGLHLLAPAKEKVPLHNTHVAFVVCPGNNE